MTTQNINYRLLTEADKNLYREIRLDCLRKYPDNFGSTYSEEINKESLKFDEAMHNNTSANFICGAFFNFNLVGICGFSRDNRLKTMHQGEISQMYVNPDFGRQGIGTSLLNFTINKAFDTNTIELILLGVVSVNTIAISAYKKLGFIQCGLIENYFKYGDKYLTQVLMSLTKEKYIEVQS